GAEQSSRSVVLATAAGRLFLAGSGTLADELLADCESASGGLERGEPMVAAHVHRARAERALVLVGDPSTFLEEMERGAERFDEIGDARESCFQRANVGYALASLGRWEEAEQELRSSLATAERMGLDHVASGARSNLGIVLGRLGRFREAHTQEQRAVSFFEEHADRRLAGASRLYLAILYLLEGDAERAEEAARAALAYLTWGTQAQALATLARALLTRGKVDEALAQ